MKKSIIAIVTILLTVSVLMTFGCGAKDKPADAKIPAPGSIDVTQLAKNIYDNCKFDDSGLAQSPNPEFVVCTVYGADAALVAGETGAKKTAVYNSSASPEMIICIEAADEESAESLMAGTFVAMVDDYINNYTNYGPAEVTKLTSAVKIVRGTYVILTVSADNAAAQTYIEGLLG